MKFLLAIWRCMVDDFDDGGSDSAEPGPGRDGVDDFARDLRRDARSWQDDCHRIYGRHGTTRSPWRSRRTHVYGAGNRRGNSQEV